MGDSKVVSLGLVLDADPEAKVKAAQADQARAQRPKNLIKSLSELGDGMWLDQKPDPRPMLLKTKGGVDFLPLGIVAMLAAPGGTGKSLALLQLAVSIAAGIDWFGCFEPTTTGRVLMAFGEENNSEIKRRLQIISRALSMTPTQQNQVFDNIDVMPLRGMSCRLQNDGNDGPSEFATYLQTDLDEIAQSSRPWSLIILDPASRFMGAEAEISNAAATRFIEVCENLTKLSGTPTVMLAHHTPKAALGNDVPKNQSVARGSSALVDGVRLLLTLFPATSEDQLVGSRVLNLELPKTNYTPPMKTMKLKNDGGAIVQLTDLDKSNLPSSSEDRQGACPNTRAPDKVRSVNKFVKSGASTRSSHGEGSKEADVVPRDEVGDDL
jgi:RecA-family ATPase